MNLNQVLPGMIKISSRGMCENQNRIRKSWVLAIEGTLFQAKVQTYPLKQRLEVYKQFDSMVREEYLSLLRANKRNAEALNLHSSQIICGCHILHKEAQIDLDEFLIDAMYIIMEPLSDTFKVFEG